MTIKKFLEERVQKNFGKPFLFYDDLVITYEHFDCKVNQAAQAFCNLGIRKGDKVSLMLPNVPEFLYAWFGLAKIGAVMVPVNTAYKANEAAYIISHSDSICVVFTREHLPVIQCVQKECPSLRWLICTEEPSDVLYFDKLCEEAPAVSPNVDLNEDDLVEIIYTSGTTGFPKGVMHVHRDMTMCGEAFTLCADLTKNDRVMVILPLFHANAQYYSTMGALAAEASLVLIQRFSASTFWEQAVRFGATEFNFVGAIGRILCRRPIEEFRSDHQIRTAYGALIATDTYKYFGDKFRIKNIIDGYGSTEVPRVSQNPIGGKIKLGSMGLPARHPNQLNTFAEVKVVDEAGREVSPGVKGELVIRSPVMMKGYYKDSAQTNEVLRDGWFYSGDYVFQDREGYLFFVDRKKDIIRRKGENISATEIESVINECEKIMESAVIAVPSDLGEDEILAIIVLKESVTMTVEEVVDVCRKKLAAFKIPRYLQFRESLPKTSTERIAKYQLKAEIDLIARSIDIQSLAV